LAKYRSAFGGGTLPVENEDIFLANYSDGLTDALPR
jgi:hypothetical protein